MPIFGYHIGGGIQFKNQTSTLEQSLIAPPGLIAVRTSQSKVWDLVSAGNVSSDSHECDAAILTTYLDIVNEEDGGLFWTDWNNDYPKSAKLFWPAVADLARCGLYIGIPDVMSMALDIEEDKPKRFGPALKQTLASVYIQQAISEREKGDLEQAIVMCTKSIDVQPTVKGYKLRAEMLLATGKTSRAERDRVEAGRLDH